MAAEANSPKTALVLCGGGSRGAVEVGLYRALVELGVRIDFVVGSSIGAVNGALIAAGLTPAEVEQHWKTIRTRDVLGPRWRLLRLLTGASSVFDNQRLRELLWGRLPARSFGQLILPLAVVATDLETGEAVVLEDGDLVEAILASTALPGLFPPIRWNGRRLVDGGLSDNVPSSGARNGSSACFADVPKKCRRGPASSPYSASPSPWPLTLDSGARRLSTSMELTCTSWNLVQDPPSNCWTSITPGCSSSRLTSTHFNCSRNRWCDVPLRNHPEF